MVDDAPNQRSFGLNSDEAYAAMCRRAERPWIPNGALPREPRVWEREVVVEAGRPCRGAGAQRGRRAEPRPHADKG